MRPRHVTLVLPRHAAGSRLRRYNDILSGAGIWPERAILNAQGLVDIRQEGPDVMPQDLRLVILARRRRRICRRCVYIFVASISCWCAVMFGLIKDQEAGIRRAGQTLFAHKTTAAMLTQREAVASFRKDVIRDEDWRRMLDSVFERLSPALSLTHVRFGLDGSLDLAGQTTDVDALMAYIDVLKKDGWFSRLRWEIADVSKEGVTLFRVQTQRS